MCGEHSSNDSKVLGALGTICASYPTCKEQRELDNILQLSWKVPCSPGKVSLKECTDTVSMHSQCTRSRVRALWSLVKGWMLLLTLLTLWQSCKTGLALVSARKFQAGNEWGFLVFSFAPSSSNNPLSPSFLLLFFFVRMNVIWLVTPILSNDAYR